MLDGMIDATQQKQMRGPNRFISLPAGDTS